MINYHSNRFQSEEAHDDGFSSETFFVEQFCVEKAANNEEFLLSEERSIPDLIHLYFTWHSFSSGSSFPYKPLLYCFIVSIAL